eukprot:SAG11_NODE_565_length_8503_cov_20.810209_5_plen_108_part_00
MVVAVPAAEERVGLSGWQAHTGEVEAAEDVVPGAVLHQQRNKVLGLRGLRFALPLGVQDGGSGSAGAAGGNQNGDRGCSPCQHWHCATAAPRHELQPRHEAVLGRGS